MDSAYQTIQDILPLDVTLTQYQQYSKTFENSIHMFLLLEQYLYLIQNIFFKRINWLSTLIAISVPPEFQ